MLRFWSSVFILGLTLPWSASALTYADMRAEINGLYAATLSGDCRQMAKVAVCESDPRSSPTGPELEAIIRDVADIGTSEPLFFQRAAADQMAHMRCNIRQLAAMRRGDKASVEFQRTVMGQLRDKLPELRRNYAPMRACQARLDELNKELDGVARGVARSFHSPDQAENLRADIARRRKEEERTCTPITDAYNMLYLSLWNAQDPIMLQFVDRVVQSPKSPQRIFEEGMGAESNNGILRRLTGTAEFSFRTEVLDAMEEKALSDSQKLKDQSVGKRGEVFRVEDLNISTRQMLVESSDWADHLQLSVEGKNVSSAILMCTLDQRYVKGKEYVDTTVNFLSLFAGGVGVFGKLYSATRYARLMAPLRYQTLLKASNLATYASTYLSLPLALDQVHNECVDSRPGSIYRGPKVCNEETISNFALVERTRVEQENCILAGVLAAVAAAPAVMDAAKAVAPTVRNYLGESFQSSLARYRNAAVNRLTVMRTPAGKVSDDAAEVQQTVVIQAQDDIVITARRPKGRPAAPVTTDPVVLKELETSVKEAEESLKDMYFTYDAHFHLRATLGTFNAENLPYAKMKLERLNFLADHIRAMKVAALAKAGTPVSPEAQKLINRLTAAETKAREHLDNGTSIYSDALARVGGVLPVTSPRTLDQLADDVAAEIEKMQAAERRIDAAFEQRQRAVDDAYARDSLSTPELSAANKEIAAAQMDHFRLRQMTDVRRVELSRSQIEQFEMQNRDSLELVRELDPEALNRRVLAAFNEPGLVFQPPYHPDVPGRLLRTKKPIRLCRIQADASSTGSWFLPCSYAKKFTRQQIRDLVAIPDANTAKHIYEVEIPAGVEIEVTGVNPIRDGFAGRIDKNFGPASAGGGGHGGGIQYRVSGNVNEFSVIKELDVRP